MSFRRDYILRMIEMIGELIAGILGLIKKGKFEQAEEAIDQAYLDYLKEDAAFFRNIKSEDLTEELMQNHNYTHSHLEVLAELFYAEGELHTAKGNIKPALDCYRKSLKLHQFVIDESDTFSVAKEQKSEYLQKQINELEERLH